MLGNDPRLNPLQSRKRLLVAESEINRLQLAEEWQAMTEGVRTLRARVKSVSSLASVTALMVAGVSAFRRGKSVSTRAKSTWFQTALKGAQMVGSLWLAYRTRPR